MRYGTKLALAGIALLGSPSRHVSQTIVATAREAQAPATIALTNRDVLDLIKSGLTAEVVVAKIKSSQCEFDTSPSSLKELKSSGVPDSVILAMVEASPKPKPEAKLANNLPPPTPEQIADREKHERYCAVCPSVFFAYVEANSGKLTPNWLSNHQLGFLKKRVEEIAKGKIQPALWVTPYIVNADYFVIWTQAQGYRPYVYYVPHTQTETGNVSGSYNSYGSGGYDYGDFNGTVNVTRTYYTQQTGQIGYVDVTLDVYNAKTGQKVYGTWHRGNWRWSKPDKDCLEDAMKYLSASKR